MQWAVVWHQIFSLSIRRSIRPCAFEMGHTRQNHPTIGIVVHPKKYTLCQPDNQPYQFVLGTLATIQQKDRDAFLFLKGLTEWHRK